MRRRLLWFTLRLAIALLPLLAALQLRIWTKWAIGPREARGVEGTAWEAIRMIPYNVRDIGVLRFIWDYSVGNLAQAIFLLLLGVSLENLLFSNLGAARVPSTLCEVCGYDLRATPDRCPECGAVPAAKGGAA